MGLNLETITVAGTEVAVTRHPERPLLLLTRMASRGMGIWDTVWPALAERFYVASFDLSMPSAERLDDPAAVFRDYAAQCSAIARELGFEGYHVLGWNGGSHVALQCAADDAEHVRSCVLVGAFYRLADMRRIEAGIEFMRIMFENPDRKLYALYWLMAGFSQNFVERNYMLVDQWAEARIGGDRLVNQDVARVMKWVRALRSQWVDEDRLRTIDTPLLIVAPSVDHWHAGPTVEMADALHAAIPGSHLQVLDGAGSMIVLEDPKRFLAAVTPFYEEIMA